MSGLSIDSPEWDYIWSEIHTHMEKHRDLRNLNKQAEVEAQRTSVFLRKYTLFFNSLDGRERLRAPSPETALQLSTVADAIHAPADDDISQTTIETIITQLPDILKAWRVRPNLYLQVIDTFIPASYRSRVNQPTQHIPPTHRATAVFLDRRDAQHHSFTVGFDAMKLHAGKLPQGVVFSQLGARVVLAMLQARNLDPRSTDPCLLDALDDRYICRLCPTMSARGHVGKPAFTWRQMVRRYLTSHRRSKSLTSLGCGPGSASHRLYEQ